MDPLQIENKLTVVKGEMKALAVKISFVIKFSTLEFHLRMYLPKGHLPSACFSSRLVSSRWAFLIEFPYFKGEII